MELFCEKYGETVESEEPACRHPEDYCQFRSGCMIHFIERERKREQNRAGNARAQGEQEDDRA